jgi:endonuclease/exonuclease/phosphatase family metal-dependent hydrolase
MNPIRIGTFNCENLFMRYNFQGPSVPKKNNETDADYKKRVDAARSQALKQFETSGASIDWLRTDLENFSTISSTQREATAKLIWDSQNSPDIIALMEIENMDTLRKFNSTNFFKDHAYPYYLLIDGNDPRGIDVALLSRYPMRNIGCHIWDKYDKNGKKVPTFSRDCLKVEIDINGTLLTMFVNHLKSQADDDPDKRKHQAAAIASIVEDTFGAGIDNALFAIVGDFNQVPGDASLQPLLSRPWHEQMLSRLPAGEQWTHVWAKTNTNVEVSQLDYILLSKKLAKNVSKAPWIDRRGLAKYAGLNKYYPGTAQRILPTVEGEGTEASDHCPVFVEVAI